MRIPIRFCGVLLFLYVCICVNMVKMKTDAATSAEEYHKFAPFICMKAYLNGKREDEEKKRKNKNTHRIAEHCQGCLLLLYIIYIQQAGESKHNGHPFFSKTKYGFGMSFWPHNNEHGFLFGVCSERTDRPIRVSLYVCVVLCTRCTRWAHRSCCGTTLCGLSWYTRHFSWARKIKFRQNEILYLSFNKYLARDEREVGKKWKEDIPISTTIQNKMDDGCEEKKKRIINTNVEEGIVCVCREREGWIAFCWT